MSFNPGEVLRVEKVRGAPLPEPGWAIVLDAEDAMLFVRMPSGWTSRVLVMAWCDEETRLALADEVPDDVPADFWPLSAKRSLG